MVDNDKIINSQTEITTDRHTHVNAYAQRCYRVRIVTNCMLRTRWYILTRYTYYVSSPCVYYLCMQTTETYQKPLKNKKYSPVKDVTCRVRLNCDETACTSDIKTVHNTINRPTVRPFPK